MDIMVVYYSKTDNGIKYRCGGYGSTYDHFYNKWIPSSSYQCTSVDFPWDYFIFRDPEDHQRLLDDYPNCVFPEESE